MQVKIVFYMKNGVEFSFGVEKNADLYANAKAKLDKIIRSTFNNRRSEQLLKGWDEIGHWNIFDMDGRLIPKNKALETVLSDETTKPPVDKTDGVAQRSPLQKTRFDLLPIGPLIEVAQVFTFGAFHYGDRNWEYGFSWSRCIGSVWRHFLKWCAGEELDDESGLSHLAHVVANILFLMEYTLNGKGTDDRKKYDSELIEKLFKPLNIDSTKKKA